MDQITKDYSAENIVENNDMPDLISKLASDDLQIAMLSDSMSIDDIERLQKNLMQKKEKMERKAKVLEVHKNRISPYEVNKRGKQIVRYQTRVSGIKTPIQALSEEKLFDKLYDIYFPENGIRKNDCSFSAVFKQALQHRINCKPIAQETIRDYEQSLRTYIEEDFANRDIRTITVSDIQAYFNHITTSKRMTKSMLKKMKSLFHLVFGYASAMDIHIIEYNPMLTDLSPYERNCVISGKSGYEKAMQPDEIRVLQSYLWKRITEVEYPVYEFAVLFAIETGVRCGELPALRWSDVSFSLYNLHIHSSQIGKRLGEGTTYEIVGYTKNERGKSRGGRNFPLSDEAIGILNTIKELQKKLNIHSEENFIFCQKDGGFIKKNRYCDKLRDICKRRLGLSVTNNHSFRMALNSYKLVPGGISTADRAEKLGHSVEVNNNHYTLPKRESNEDIRKILNQNYK